MSKIIENDFTKEFTSLLEKHKKYITADKSGIKFIDKENDCKITYLLKVPTEGTDDSDDILIILKHV